MKKVIVKPKESKTIILADIRESMVIGIEWEDEKRSIVLKNERGFFSLSNSRTDISSCFYKDTMHEYLQRILKQNPDLFVFDSVKECLKWMSE